MEERQAFFEQTRTLYERAAHFPTATVRTALAECHPLEADILPFLFYLPGQISGQRSLSACKIAAAFVITDFGFCVHDQVRNDGAARDKHYVLLGDYLLTQSYRFLSECCGEEVLHDCAAIFTAVSSAWFLWRELPERARRKEARVLPILEQEFGLLFREVAMLGAQDAGLAEEQRHAFMELAAQLAILWGLQKRDGRLDPAPYRAAARAHAAGLGVGDEVEWLLAAM